MTFSQEQPLFRQLFEDILRFRNALRVKANGVGIECSHLGSFS